MLCTCSLQAFSVNFSVLGDQYNSTKTTGKLEKLESLAENLQNIEHCYLLISIKLT